MNDYFKEGFEKIAKSEPGYWAKQKGITRATTDGGKQGKGSSYIGFINKDLANNRFKESVKGTLKGGLGGAALGAAASLLSRGKVKPGTGAAVGGTIGAIGGDAVGSRKADREYLAKRGIKTKWHGFGTKFSPKARKKYIDSYEKKR